VNFQKYHARELSRFMRILFFAILLALPGVLFSQESSTAQPPSFASREPRYRIQPNDVVDVQFRYTPEFNTSATVQPDGFISTQIAGDIHVAGMTLTEVSAAIVKQSSARLKDPEVTVLLKDFVKPHFVVAGEVAHPGSFELRGDVGIVQAIAMSGGFKDSAHRKQVVLVRKMNSEVAEVKVYDVNQLMNSKAIREDIHLRPDDMLMVPRNTLSKLEPYIRLSSLGVYGLTFGLP
jgi:polysaccharide export outer membrane protein